jgi:hypothetical protein
MTHESITAFQLAHQRHHADLRSAELRRAARLATARSAGPCRRPWFAGSFGRARVADLIDAAPIVELRRAC